MSCIARWFAVRSALAAFGSLRETDRSDKEDVEGDAGGGIETELGTRCRGVRVVRGLVGVPVGDSIPEPAVRPAFGVNGELTPRGGEVKLWTGEAILLEVGLGNATRVGLAAPVPRVVNCFAVIPTYLDALDPGVIIDSEGAAF